ncbi:MAG: threonine--tRNA ligase [Mycoplasmatota bacterium]
MKNEESAKLLKELFNEKYNISYENLNYNEEEFYYEFKILETISENDFLTIEKELKKRNKQLFIKLLRISSVYLNGNANNEMITRIVGKSFLNELELNEYLEKLKEAKERDHRKIGQELDLFCFSDYVGAGLPLYTPRGTIVKDQLQKEIERVCRNYGFEKVSCPSLADISLFETSGHAKKFNEELFRVHSLKGHEFALKPVQCPHHTQIYASKLRSYKDLPIRYMESDKQYRAELQGAVGGLSRVYAITVEDGHSFCRVDQVKQEVINMCNLIKEFYTNMGLFENNWISLSLRDYENPDKYIGVKEDWEVCEKMLEEVCEELELNAIKCEGEAALYGPKIDFMFKDAFGREIQIPTVQLDFATPKRFNLSYIDEFQNKQTPVMVHRAVLGSYERFLVLLLEKFKGVLPIWLSPVQANIIPINMNYHNEYAQKIKKLLLDEEIRVNLDDNQESFKKKLKNNYILKNPITIIIGDNERDNNLISFKKLGQEETFTFSIDEFIKYIKEEIKKR